MKKIKLTNLVALLLAISMVASVQQTASSITQSAEQTGLLTGTVFDPNKAVVVGADVFIRGKDKTFKLTTNDEGIYKIELPEGMYNIEINSSGFLPSKETNHLVLSGANQPVDVIMKPSGVPICILTVEAPKVKRRKGRRSRRNQ